MYSLTPSSFHILVLNFILFLFCKGRFFLPPFIFLFSFLFYFCSANEYFFFLLLYSCFHFYSIFVRQRKIFSSSLYILVFIFILSVRQRKIFSSFFYILVLILILSLSGRGRTRRHVAGQHGGEGLHREQPQHPHRRSAGPLPLQHFVRHITSFCVEINHWNPLPLQFTLHQIRPSIMWNTEKTAHSNLS